MMQRKPLSIFWLLLFITPCLAETNEPRHSGGIKLTGQHNFRDLGGYETEDGLRTQKGILYRSGELQTLTDEDVKTLEALGIKAVVNFLTPDEIKARGKDRLPPGTQEILFPIDGGVAGNLARTVLQARQTGDFSQVPVELNPELHRLLIELGADSYAGLVRTILDQQGRPLVFHCSHGVHRTGTASAIILSLVGVPWETVREDYLLSNQARAAETKKRLAQLRELAAQKQGISPQEVDTTNMEAFYILEGSYIDASLHEINKKYGSVLNYAKERLELTDQEISELKAILLEKPKNDGQQ